MSKINIKQTEIGEIPKDWELLAIDDVAEVVGGGTPSTKDPSYFGGNIPWITPKDLSNFHSRYISRGERNITQKGLEESSAKLLPPNAVLLTTRAPVGYVAIAKNEVTTNQGFRSLIPRHNVISEYLYYLLKINTERLKSNASGTTFGELSGSTLKSLKFPFPQIEEQRAIAKIISDLDDKIELNHQMNKTLESIAQAIFKRWFVDFEFLAHKKVKFVNGLPEGWHEGKLIDICDIVMGQSPPGETYNESGEGTVFYQGNRDFGFRFPTPRVYCTAPTRMAEAGDILISVRAPVGALNITPEQCAIGRGVAALRMKHYSNGFLFYFLVTKKDLWNRFNSEGTVFGCLNKAEFHKVSLVIPSDIIMRQFDVIIKPIEAMILKNEQESCRLAEIRDSLLPRLMSGKIRVN